MVGYTDLKENGPLPLRGDKTLPGNKISYSELKFFGDMKVRNTIDEVRYNDFGFNLLFRDWYIFFYIYLFYGEPDLSGSQKPLTSYFSIMN